MAGAFRADAPPEAGGVPVRPDHELPGVRRCHIDDPFGNRIELIEHQ